MQENKNNINDSNDEFSQLVRQKLENHQLPVSEDVWKGIEQQLAPASKRRVGVWYWIAGGVAAVVALMLLIRPLDFSQSDKNFAEKTITNENTGKPIVASVRDPASNSTATVADEVIHQTVPAGHKTTAGLLKHEKQLVAENKLSGKANQPIGVNQSVTTTPKAEISDNSINKIDKNRLNAEVELASNQFDKQIVTTKTNSEKKQPEKITSLPDLSDYPEEPAEEPVSKKEGNWLLAASTGASTNVNTTGKFDLFDTNSEYSANLGVSDNVKGEYTNIMNTDYYNETEYLTPLSFGLLVEKSLDKTLSIQSGLVYTYLETRLKRTSYPTSQGRLKLHYIGVPLDLKAKLWKNTTWSIYMTAGGMMEKGIRSIYTQDIDYTWNIAHTKVYSNINGLQWSINSGLGINYKIQKNLNLFFEPKLIYYLKNNQPMSARTDQQLVIGVNGGLTIGF